MASGIVVHRTLHSMKRGGIRSIAGIDPINQYQL